MWCMNEPHHPSCFVLSQQNIATLDRSVYDAASGTEKGAYVLECASPEGKPDVVLMASGSEVPLIVDAPPREERGCLWRLC